ncbi:MAG: bifunctional (p)ppGpp synthetase/guanosine-3',5'-bis(diphosphate) 3'-pyrophosphohydrolase [Desulfobacterales bacterium]|nr:bifunctional (p)ppGpp synthetase/guanosine-3',5'-bis(diphosphate) 3'-pyrophosphohydrolase [Desulfobacterales bacterium]MBF0397908.1 bifunctional (p)ppGpp synthetase/guanosine-3',5'-bis(diphosphate) 3'-pyrophosphohydrolase [Desulfobacterales bacterium]
MIRINDIVDKISDYNPSADLDIIDRAYIFSARVHQGQVRLSGEPYLIHPLEVAAILADLKLDEVSIVSGLLHDVIEDTWATPEQLRDMFGDDVCHIVEGVTKLSAITSSSMETRQAENLRKMILAMAKDIRVVLVKISDRLHNMRTLQFHKEHKRKDIARETLDIYAPIAGRLGIYWMKKELEDSAFMYLLPEEYNKIDMLVKNNLAKGGEYIEIVKNLIKQKLDESNIESEIVGRYKHYYSIYQKMLRQNLTFDELYDIIAFRIVVDNMHQCYMVLGLIHALWKPIPKKFKDYIGTPKPNGYQSLHSSVIGPLGKRMEIQIRTHDMDKVARSGIAAHWSYKEGKRTTDEEIRKTFKWLQDLVENQAQFRDPKEFLENVRIDLFPDEVYVFTPKGEVKSMPRGATPIDFAYMVHTELGNQCISAKVNGRVVPLRYELKTGDIVEVISAKGHTPSRDWLKFVKTVKARSRIRQWIKIQEKERSLPLGREMCEKEFEKHKLDFNVEVKSEKMKKVVEDFGYKDIDDLIADIGYGKFTPHQIAKKFIPEEPEAQESLLTKIIGRVTKKKKDVGVIVSGVDDVLIRFGKCCHPLPGDPIIGYITRGYGVAIHRSSCVHALRTDPERRIDVNWREKSGQIYPVKICIVARDRVGLLADIATNIAKNSANILNANTGDIDENNTSTMLFTIAVEDNGHLDKVVAAIKKVKLVQSVVRIS